VSSQPVINGQQYGHASVSVDIDGEVFFGVSSINYGSELETNPVHGTGHQQVGTVFGTLKHSGDMEMPKLHGARLRSKLGPGYMKKLCTITVTYREVAMSELHTDVISAYVKNDSTSSSAGGDPVKDKFELHPTNILRDGLSPVETE
jgi:hypothetical protein